MSTRGGGGGGRGDEEERGRISKLVRILARVDSVQSFQSTVTSIQDNLHELDNRKYVQRSFIPLSTSLAESFKGLASGVSWREEGVKALAVLLSRISQVLDRDFGRLHQWMISNMTRKSKAGLGSVAFVVHDVMMQMLERMDVDQISCLADSLQQAVEEVETAGTFKIITALLIGCLEHKGELSLSRFHDFVDLVIGWMVDETQEECPDLSDFGSDVLLLLKPNLLEDSSFPKTLLSQLVEDLECATKPQSRENGGTSEVRVILLAKAYAAVLRTESIMDKEFLNEYTERMVACMLDELGSFKNQSRNRESFYSFLIVINNVLSLSSVDGLSTHTFVKLELESLLAESQWKKWPKMILTSMIEGISIWTEAAISTTQLSTEKLALCDIIISLVDEMQGGHEAVRLIQVLFRTRNLPLLQKVYDWHISKLRDSSSKTQRLFVLAGISDIAVNRSGSMLSLWALQPSIFQLIMDMIMKESDDTLRFSMLTLLRSHCSIHSHFVSSIATTGSFSSESPGARFLPSLMDFWISELKTESDWMWDWVQDFLTSSSSYAPLLVQAQPRFYENLTSVCTGSQKGLAVLQFLASSDVYSAVMSLQQWIKERCLEVIFSHGGSDEQYRSCKKILSLLSDLIISSKQLVEEQSVKTSAWVISSENFLTTSEYNSFLFNLLSDDPHLESASKVDAAVDHLLRSKLKTPLGRPQEFFTRLQVMLKKQANKSEKIPSWKLQFLFELDRGLNWWINGSYIRNVELPETKNFYATNRSPCIEWLKRMRSDQIDIAMDIEDYAMAYYQSVTCNNIPNIQSSLFYLNDAEALQRTNLAAHLYLNGHFEEALKTLATNDLSSPENKSINDLITKRATLMLSSAMEKSSNPSSLDPNFTMAINQSLLHSQSLLDFQLLTSNNKILPELELHEDNFSHCNIWSVLGLNAYDGSIVCGENQKDILEKVKVQKMLECNNINYCRQWLLENGIDLMDLESGVSIPVERLEDNQFCWELAADLLILEKEVTTGAWIYQEIWRYFELSNNAALECQILLKIADRMRTSPVFCEAMCKELESSIGELSQTPRNSLHYLYQKALNDCPSDQAAWLAFGNFNFEFAEASHPELKSAYKEAAVESFTNFLRLQSIETGKRKSGPTATCMIKTMSRLLTLCKEGYEFEPDEVLVQKSWLQFLPEISQIPFLRSTTVRRFPKESSLYFISYDSTQSNWKSSLMRKNLFDPSAFLLTEVSDEPLHPLPNVRMKGCGCSSPVSNLREKFLLRSELNISEEIKVIGRELMRVGNSPEEIWSWSLQRVLVDWNRRVSSLKKDLCREADPFKMEVYLEPVKKYLQGLWEETQKAESPVEMSFVKRNSLILPQLINNVFNSTSVEALISAFDKLLFHAETFESFISYKYSLEQLSPKLAKLSELEQLGEVSIPGLPDGVIVCSINPIVYSLATKTKPKKIKFRGSNGKSYEYLVKGNENLHIDSGVMQFLEVSAKILNMESRAYSVTPLGKRGGLIQMVEGAVPIFLLYKKYLQRNNCVERTSEMFWRRMNALGCTDRSDFGVLKQVFESLKEETSSEIISRELLLGVKDVSSWYEAVKRFTKDAAFSSAVGYILGIGDRHLDNILVNLREGKLIHVDFSVIFGKGNTLKVPECVPFRLTQSITSALQHPGIEGSFSIYLEKYLGKLQKEKEITMFCSRTIAFSSQLEEDCPISPQVIILSELSSALTMLKFRYKNMWKATQLIKCEILASCIELDNEESTLENGLFELQSCESSIENLTIAISVIKDCQSDPLKLSNLRFRCYKSRQPESSVGELSVAEQFLVHLTENFIQKSHVTVDDKQWANTLEKIVSSQLQSEVQKKFALVEVHGVNSKTESTISSRLTKRLNRWRRILANLDPLISFISSHAAPEGPLWLFKSVAEAQWSPGVAHFWLHLSTKELINLRETFGARFELMERIISGLLEQDVVQQNEPLSTDAISCEHPSVDEVDVSRIQAITQAVEKALADFNTSKSVKSLIQEATQAENLSKMFEGWTPWV